MIVFYIQSVPTGTVRGCSKPSEIQENYLRKHRIYFCENNFNLFNILYKKITINIFTYFLFTYLSTQMKDIWILRYYYRKQFHFHLRNLIGKKSWRLMTLTKKLTYDHVLRTIIYLSVSQSILLLALSKSILMTIILL